MSFYFINIQSNRNKKMFVYKIGADAVTKIWYFTRRTLPKPYKEALRLVATQRRVKK